MFYVRLSFIRTASVSLGAEGEGSDIRSDADSASRAAAAGVDGKVVRAAALPAATRKALRIVAAAHVGPLAQRGLAKEHSSGVTKLGYNMGITRDPAAKKSPAASSSLHIVVGANVVLDRERNAMQGAADLACLALSIALSGDGESIGVDLENGAIMAININ